jgi:hypothetical protein
MSCEEVIDYCLFYLKTLHEERKLLEIALALYDLEDEENSLELCDRFQYLIKSYLCSTESSLDELKCNLDMLKKNFVSDVTTTSA